MSNKKFESLLAGFLNDSLSPEELQLFLQWVHNPEHENQLLSSIENTMSSTEILELKNKDGIFKKIIEHKSAEEYKDFAIEKREGKLKNLFAYWKVAAAVIILLSGGIFYMLTKDSTKSSANQQASLTPTTDVAPGGNKAILQLADGSTIILDSANNGNIANQGQTKIIKIDGQLAYNAAGSSAEILYNTISTPRGGQYQLILADGTKVWLNAASSLRFPTNFSGNERNVTLTGEGYFEVAKNENTPFKVDVAGRGEVEVLGTHFNVNAYEDEASIHTTLLEGSVKFTEPNSHLSKFILPGQQAQFNGKGKIIIKDDIDIEGVMAWKNGIFNFNNANLQTVLKQLSRWYDVDVVVEGNLPNRVFAGEMQRNLNLSQVLELLEKNRLKFKIDGKKLIVLK